jgi:septum formation protein
MGHLSKQDQAFLPYFRALHRLYCAPHEQFSNMMNNTEITLASTSPFRRALLERLGVPFQTQSPNFEETRIEDESPDQMVQRLALGKARAIETGSGLVIGSDQCAELDGNILGKPGTHEQAVIQLKASSGRTVRFHTGLCLLNRDTGQYQLDNIQYEVVFRVLSDSQIEHYLLREQPYQCAGSFKSEAMGITLFEAMRGDDPTSLIGLPLIRLTSMLAKEGLVLPLAP